MKVERPRIGHRRGKLVVPGLRSEQHPGSVGHANQPEIGGGYGKLSESTFRIGHMGDHTVDELDALLDVVAGALK
jgi:aspartate aminotransferase-like enzyme